MGETALRLDTLLDTEWVQSKISDCLVKVVALSVGNGCEQTPQIRKSTKVLVPASVFGACVLLTGLRRVGMMACESLEMLCAAKGWTQ